MIGYNTIEPLEINNISFEIIIKPVIIYDNEMKCSSANKSINIK